MKRWIFFSVGAFLWIVFVDAIAPDLSLGRRTVFGFVGLMAIIFLATSAMLSVESRPNEERKDEAES